jgi:hypothetical protein
MAISPQGKALGSHGGHPLPVEDLFRSMGSQGIPGPTASRLAHPARLEIPAVSYLASKRLLPDQRRPNSAAAPRQVARGVRLGSAGLCPGSEWRS